MEIALLILVLLVFMGPAERTTYDTGVGSALPGVPEARSGAGHFGASAPGVTGARSGAAHFGGTAASVGAGAAIGTLASSGAFGGPPPAQITPPPAFRPPPPAPNLGQNLETAAQIYTRVPVPAIGNWASSQSTAVKLAVLPIGVTALAHDAITHPVDTAKAAASDVKKGAKAVYSGAKKVVSAVGNWF